VFQFQLFGIPVRIEPWFWLTAFLLGGGMRLGSGSTRVDIVWILVWMVVICFSVLVHEFGHALTSRKLSGGRNHIRLWALGGLAYHEGGRETRKARLWTIFMGPGAGFGLFLLTVLAMLATLGAGSTAALVPAILIGWPINPELVSPELLEYLSGRPASLRFFEILLLINFWWSLINLLPVFPLDGGQFLATFSGNQILAYKVGVVVGIAGAVLMLLWTGSLWNTLIFGFLAWQNHQGLKASRASGGPPRWS
jgi:Zn-dependent protease